MNSMGVSPANVDRTYNFGGERCIERTLAALLMAGLAVTVYFTGRLLLARGCSAMSALGTALGTQMWSTASRGLWSDTWGIFLLGFVVWMLLAHEARSYRLRPVLLASLLAWAYFVRPTYSIPILGITAYVVLFQRPLFVRYALTGAAWCAAFVAYSWLHFGRPLPSYYSLGTQLQLASLRTGLLANLVSPSRGLLIFVPIVLFVAYLLVRYVRELPVPRLVVLSAGIVAAHLVAVSGFWCWWAGWSYGPRFSTGLVPWFAMLAVVGLSARAVAIGAQVVPARRRRTELALGAALLAISIVMNGIGANSRRAAGWNAEPVNIDAHPERIWDWRHPQFLAK
jgi:hypothetical protein